MLHHRLSGSEGTRHGCHAPFGDGEEGVDDSLSRHKGHIRRKLFLVGTALTHRPFLHKADGMLPAFFVRQNRNGVCNCIFSGLNGCQGTGKKGWNHDLLADHGGFLDVSQNIASADLVSHRG